MGRDPQYIEKTLKRWHPILHSVFRSKVSGFEKLGAGPYLLVSNHNIGAPFEVMALLEAWEAQAQSPKPVYGLAHTFVFKIPWLSKPFRKLGGIPATFDCAFRALDSGHSVAIFPGGNYESVRPFSQRGLCDFGGKKGWAKIALSRGVQVVPISIVGSHSINPVLFRSRFLATLLGVPRLLGITWFPITLSQIVYSTAVALVLIPIAPIWFIFLSCYLVFLSSVQFPIWPAQIQILVHTPINLTEQTANIGDESQKLEFCYQEVTQAIQTGMNSLNSAHSAATPV